MVVSTGLTKLSPRLPAQSLDLDGARTGLRSWRTAWRCSPYEPITGLAARTPLGPVINRSSVQTHFLTRTDPKLVWFNPLFNFAASPLPYYFYLTVRSIFSLEFHGDYFKALKNVHKLELVNQMKQKNSLLL